MHGDAFSGVVRDEEDEKSAEGVDGAETGDRVFKSILMSVLWMARLERGNVQNVMRPSMRSFCHFAMFNGSMEHICQYPSI